MTTSNIPNTFQHPNWLVDELGDLLTPEEHWVLTYTVRHILGWKNERLERQRPISLSMYESGFHSSKRYYRGTGLSRPTLIKILKLLVETGLLIKVEVTQEGTVWHLPDEPDIDWDKLHTRFEKWQRAAQLHTQKIKAGKAAKRGGKPSLPGSTTFTSTGKPDLLNQTQANPGLLISGEIKRASAASDLDWECAEYEAYRDELEEETPPKKKGGGRPKVDTDRRLAIMELIAIHSYDQPEGLHLSYMSGEELPEEIRGQVLTMAKSIDKSLSESSYAEVLTKIRKAYKTYADEGFHGGEGRIKKASTLLDYVHKANGGKPRQKANRGRRTIRVAKVDEFDD